MEEGAGFEPAVFEICSHVLWATQPPFYIMEQDIGFEPMTFSLATRHSTTELILHCLAESIGIEPIHPLLNDSLANCCNNRSANSPLFGGSGEIRTHGPFTVDSFQDCCNQPGSATLP